MALSRYVLNVYAYIGYLPNISAQENLRRNILYPQNIFDLSLYCAVFSTMEHHLLKNCCLLELKGEPPVLMRAGIFKTENLKRAGSKSQMDPIQMRMLTIPLGYSGYMNGISSTSWISVSEHLRALLTEQISCHLLSTRSELNHC
jgi:hypothetical protein